MFPYLQLGSFGEAVRGMQAALNKLPTSLAQLKEDAQFGSKTHARVHEFQGQHNLSQDGVAGPLTLGALEEAVKLIMQIGFPPAEESAIRDRIVNIAQAHLGQWGGEWKSGIDKPSQSLKIAGKICIDEVTRLRQGGSQIALFFSTMGVANPQKCLTISKEAVAMYGRKYTATERNNIDIASWCGIFAFYIYKLAGLGKIPSWSAIRIHGVSNEKLPGSTKPTNVPKERCQMRTTATPKKGDIGVIGARPVFGKDGKVVTEVGQNHHFIVTDVVGKSVTSIDGNSGLNMEILGNNYAISDVLLSGGFYTPIWENCM